MKRQVAQPSIRPLCPGRHVYLWPGVPKRENRLSLYGFALRYAEKEINGGKYTSLGLPSNPEAIQDYEEDAAEGGRIMDFRVFVPKGYGNLNDTRLPNIQETEDPDRVFTASFNGGR